MKCVSRQMKKKQEVEQGAAVLSTIVTLICWVIHREYGWDKDQLQKLVDTVYEEIIKADRFENIDWMKSVDFWRDRMGLRI